MLAVYNILLLHGKYDIDYSDFITFVTVTHTRDHMFSISQEYRHQEIFFLLEE